MSKNLKNHKKHLKRLKRKISRAKLAIGIGLILSSCIRGKRKPKVLTEITQDAKPLTTEEEIYYLQYQS